MKCICSFVFYFKSDIQLLFSVGSFKVIPLSLTPISVVRFLPELCQPLAWKPAVPQVRSIRTISLTFVLFSIAITKMGRDLVNLPTFRCTLSNICQCISVIRIFLKVAKQGQIVLAKSSQNMPKFILKKNNALPSFNMSPNGIHKIACIAPKPKNTKNSKIA